jgi:transcriptional antiterminator Rof (Rho-off)
MRKLLLLLLLSLPLLAGPKSETYSGTILSTEEDFCGKSVDYVLQASLATENRGNLVLVLAPKWYMLKLKLEIRVGDKIEATVLRNVDGKLHVLTIRTAGKTFRLRDAKGKALWKPEPGSEDLFKTICKA